MCFISSELACPDKGRGDSFDLSDFHDYDFDCPEITV